MAKRYDPILCMMVEEGTRTADAQKAYSVSYKHNGVYQSIGVMANSPDEAVEKARKHFTSKGKNAEILGASIGESLETMKMKGKPILDSASVLDKAIKTLDEEEKWITVNGSHIKVDGNGNPVVGNKEVVSAMKENNQKMYEKYDNRKDYEKEVLRPYYDKKFEAGCKEDKEFRKAAKALADEWDKDGGLSEDLMHDFSLAYQKLNMMDFGPKKNFSKYMNEVTSYMKKKGMYNQMITYASGFIYDKFKGKKG